MSPGLSACVCQPEAEVFEDGSYYLFVFDEADYSHRSLAVRTDKEVGFIDLLDQAGPIFSQSTLLYKCIQNGLAQLVNKTQSKKI